MVHNVARQAKINYVVLLSKYEESLRPSPNDGNAGSEYWSSDGGEEEEAGGGEGVEMLVSHIRAATGRAAEVAEGMDCYSDSSALLVRVPDVLLGMVVVPTYSAVWLSATRAYKFIKWISFFFYV